MTTAGGPVGKRVVSAPLVLIENSLAATEILGLWVDCVAAQGGWKTTMRPMANAGTNARSMAMAACSITAAPPNGHGGSNTLRGARN